MENHPNQTLVFVINDRFCWLKEYRYLNINIGIGFNRDDAYIAFTIIDEKCSIPNMNKIPFYAKMFLDSQNNILEWNKNNSSRRKC